MFRFWFNLVLAGLLLFLMHSIHLANSLVESEEIKFLLRSEQAQPLHEWGQKDAVIDNSIYFFIDSSAWQKSMLWFQEYSKSILELKNINLTVIYYPEKKGLFKLDGQLNYDAKIKAIEIQRSMEGALDGNQIVQLRSLPTRIMLDKDRKITSKLGAPRHRLSALIWKRTTNQFRSFHFLHENSANFFNAVRHTPR